MSFRTSDVEVPLSGESGSHWLLFFWRSTVGKKVVMALTGAIGVAYVVAHMLGNLQMFEGPEKINAYAALLKSNIGLLWTARSILIVAVLLHILAAYQLARASQKSRPVGYKRWRAVGSDFASRTMRWTGVLLALFIVYHLLHLTCRSPKSCPPVISARYGIAFHKRTAIATAHGRYLSTPVRHHSSPLPRTSQPPG